MAGGIIGEIIGGVLTGGAGTAIGEGIGSLATGLGAAIPSIAEVAKVIVDRTVPDPNAKADAQRAIEEALTARETATTNAALELARAQAGINLVEAQGNDRYSSRWRPSVGWVCVFGLGYQFIAAPILTWITNIIGVMIGAAIPPAPTLSVSDLMYVAVGILGIGGMRTYERTQGIPGAMPIGK